jgi:hypothetical protein
MLIRIINIDKMDNNSKDYTFLGKHVKQVACFPPQTIGGLNRTNGLF